MINCLSPNYVILAQAGWSANAALFTFAAYIGAVLGLAWLSGQLLKSKSFVSEYFLGSRSLGMWAFALTFAATSSSGGSFIGFPSLVYTHGWIVGLWIGSYMIVPIVAMGLLAKRLNQIARKSGAITIPDVLRDRFESKSLGILATFLIVFFMAFNLIAQFKGGGVILQTLLEDVPLFGDFSSRLADVAHGIPILRGSANNPEYLACLVVFAVAVVVYTAYGGFRAVVWTDVMQGFVMVGGVVVMLPLAIWLVGGLGNATRKMAEMTPPRQAVIRLSGEAAGERIAIPKGTWCVLNGNGESSRRVFRTAQSADIPTGELAAVWRDVDESGQETFNVDIPAIEITTSSQAEEIEADSVSEALELTVVETRELKYGADRAGVYVTGPGPDKNRVNGFLPLNLAISFFFMWTFSGAGQPSNMVRLMAFKDSRILRRAIFTVSIYYTLIYFPLVAIFCCARVLLPGWETESDRIMPEMAKLLTAAIEMPWLAGLLMAAPFAAVMSTIDSFLLMISSALVRDVYQRNFNPTASEGTIKRLTYVVTVAVGAAAMLAAVNPPRYLQDIIVFTGTGLSTSFLVPVGLALYWPRVNALGAMAAMLGGVLTHITQYLLGLYYYGEMKPVYLWNFHPFLVGVVVSLTAGIIVTLCTSPPPYALVKKYFFVEK